MLARLTPYELALAAASAETVLFPAIRAEAEARGVDARDPERFTMLGTVGEEIRRLVADGPAREAGRLLYHGYHFWAADRPLYVLEGDVARELVDRSQAPDAARWTLLSPEPAGYVQLPRHLFWAGVTEDAPPEPVDGFFWTVAAQSGRDIACLELLLVLGMRADRPGFSVVDVTGRVPPGGAAGWAASRVRADGPDFDNVLPGGELERLYAITSPAEALKLAELVFHHVAERPDSIEVVRAGDVADVPAESGDEEQSRALPPSALDFRRIRPIGQAERREQEG